MTKMLLPKLLHNCVRAELVNLSGKVIGPALVALHSNGNCISVSLKLLNSHCVSVQVAMFPMWSGNLKIVKISKIQYQSYFNPMLIIVKTALLKLNSIQNDLLQTCNELPIIPKKPQKKPLINPLMNPQQTNIKS